MANNKDENKTLTQEELLSLQKELEEKQKILSSKEDELSSKEDELNKSQEAIKKAEEELKRTEAKFTEAKLKQESLSIRDKLNQQKKVTVRIPKSELNPTDLNVPVTIGGYTYNLKRGEDVSVPQEVYNILKNAGYLG